ncbi:fibronectin type III domain-containing protein [Cohnella cholangitidis]|uniref:Uncharacterized protein n=1 Tax=Cohnella cholangitidis TaxID=2598458 RepID=A0A7G5C203_9BACL|nr:fibronectin type III domain-containing protein [Cohnella cholangitidis]QMV43237.1 hypothetical protein FPL14_20175 [Cohnella cholangitidis]
MKLVSRIGLIIVLLFAHVTVYVSNAAPEEGAPSEYGEELISNGKFDGGIESWGTYPAADEIGVVPSPKPVIGQPANPVLKIHTDGIPVKWGVSEAHQWVKVQPNQPYTLSADVFFESTVDAMVTMRIDFYDSTLDRNAPSSAFISHKYKDIYHPNGGFETITISGIAPEGVYEAKVEFDIKAFEAGAKGTTYVDNVQLRHLWAPTKLRATNQTDTSISLEWDKPAFGGPYRYEVYETFGERVGEAKKPDALIDSVEGTTFTWSGLPSASAASTIAAHSLYVVAKPVSDSTLKSEPSNILRLARTKPDGAITILPLGDSMTVGIYNGGVVPGGYRGYLWELMQDKYSNMFYVGSENYNPISDARFNPDHEGHSGYQVSRMNDELVDDQIAVYAPDYVIVHAGTNNMWDIRNTDEEHMKEELLMHMNELLANIRRALPNTYVIVVSIPGIYEDRDNNGAYELLPVIAAYNRNLKELVDSLNSQGHKVGFVDMGTRVSAQYFADPDNDHIHPNAAGYKVMADIWYDALDAVITTGDVSGMYPGKPLLKPPVLNSQDTSVSLSWDAVADNIGVDRYEIFRNSEETPISVTTVTYGAIAGLAPDTSYDFSVEAIDKAGNRTRSNPLTVKTTALPDVSPPTAPTELSTAHLAHDSVTLSWLPSADDVGIREYEIMYGSKTVSVASAVYGNDQKLSHVIKGLTPETSYTFSVKAIDHAGNPSPSGTPITVETLAAPPANLHVAEKSVTSVKLAWTPTTDKDGIKGYRVYKDDSLLTTTSAASITLNDLVPGKTYTFKVTAVDQLDNETLPSNVLSLANVLQPPTGLAMSSKSYNSIKVLWSPVEGATGYNVYIDGVKKATVTGTEYLAQNLIHNTKYSFAVQTVFGANLESAIGDPIEFMTDPVPEVPRGYGGGGGGGGGSDSKGIVEYSKIDKGIKLRFVPDVLSAKISLNGSGDQWLLEVPSDKPFDRLELELSGEVLKLAASKQKPIAIQIGALTLEIAPGWLKTENQDKVAINVFIRGLEQDAAAKKQSLKPLSSGYDFEVKVNGKAVASFDKPVKLKIKSNNAQGLESPGFFSLDESQGKWIAHDKASAVGNQMTLEVSHFSEYAVLAEGSQTLKTFSDIVSHWAKEDIEFLASRNIVKGLSDGRFNPSGEVSRAEFAAMLARAFKLNAGNGSLPFEDVADKAWYQAEVKAAYQAEWIQGISGTRFAPNDRISREQMAVMIMKAYLHETKGALKPEDAEDDLPFKDAPDISSWAKEYVRLASEQKLIQGIDASFKPSLYADRAQAAAMISRLLKLLDKQ